MRGTETSLTARSSPSACGLDGAVLDLIYNNVE